MTCVRRRLINELTATMNALSGLLTVTRTKYIVTKRTCCPTAIHTGRAQTNNVVTLLSDDQQRYNASIDTRSPRFSNVHVILWPTPSLSLQPEFTAYQRQAKKRREFRHARMDTRLRFAGWGVPRGVPLPKICTVFMAFVSVSTQVKKRCKV